MKGTILFSARFLIVSIAILFLTNKGFCKILYQEDFSSDPNYTSLAPDYAYWISSGGYYYVKTRDDLNHKYWGHSPDIGLVDTSQEITIEFDVLFEYQDWGTYPGVYFYMDIPEGSEDQFRNYSSIGVLDLYTDTVFKKIRIMDDSGNYYQSSTVSDNTWYHVTIKLNGDSTADLKIIQKSNSSILLDKKSVPFSPGNFRYVGIGYFNKPDYGNAWSPIRVDNIVIQDEVARPSAETNETYGLFLGNDSWNYSGEDAANMMRDAFVNSKLIKDTNSIVDEGTFGYWTIARLLKSLLKDANKGDKLIIYLADHGGTTSVSEHQGETSGDGKSPGDEFVSSLYDDEFAEQLLSYDDLEILVIIDSCHSGGFWGDGAEAEGDLNLLSNIGLLAGSTETKKAYGRLLPLPAIGLFTARFLEGLEVIDGNIIADSNKDGIVSVTEWLTFLRDRTWRNLWIGEQVVELERGDIVILGNDDIDFYYNSSPNFSFEIKPFNQFPWSTFLPAILNSNTNQ